jgi:hypothetical protein
MMMEITTSSRKKKEEESGLTVGRLPCLIVMLLLQTFDRMKGGGATLFSMMMAREQPRAKRTGNGDNQKRTRIKCAANETTVWIDEGIVRKLLCASHR